MNAKDCRTARQEIDQAELGERLSNEVESHVAICSSCAAFKSERTRLRELVGSLRPVTAPADFDVRLRARIAREGSERARPFIFRMLLSTPAIAIATAIVVVMAAYVWISQRNHSAKSPEVAVANPAPKPLAPVVNVENQPPSSNGTTNQDSAPVLMSDNQQSSPRQRKQVASPAPMASDFSRAADFSVRRAEQIRLGQERSGEVSLAAPENPMVVSVYDEHGRERKILLPPISFGSQRLTDTRTPVSVKNTRDW